LKLAYGSTVILRTAREACIVGETLVPDVRERLRLPGAPPVPRGTYASIRGREAIARTVWGREASTPEHLGDAQWCQQCQQSQQWDMSARIY